MILSPYPDDYKHFHSTQIRANGGFNEGFYSNPQIDRTLETANRGFAAQRACGARALSGTRQR